MQSDNIKPERRKSKPRDMMSGLYLNANDFQRYVNDYFEYGIDYFGGDDYQTIFTASKRDHLDIMNHAKKIEVNITQIGFVGDKSSKPILFDENNMRISNNLNTFEHFK